MRGLTKLEIHTFKLMNKNLPTIKQSTEVALSRANTLVDVADKILAKQSTDLVDESWMERLWQWADDNKVDDLRPLRTQYKMHNYISDEYEYWPTASSFDWKHGLTRKDPILRNLTHLIIYGSVPLELEYSYDIHSIAMDCKFNRVSELPKEIGNLVNLTFLSLQQHQITKIPKEIGNLVNLTVLYLGYNQLTKLPKEIGNLVNLTHLDLRHNHLTKLPKEIGDLKYLQYLGISGNQLTELPEEITNLDKLTKIHFYVNSFLEFPKEIFNMVNLTKLSLVNIDKLPKEIGNLVNLTHLDLSGHQLTELPEEITNLNLTYLRVDGNINLSLSIKILGWIKVREAEFGMDVYGKYSSYYSPK